MLDHVCILQNAWWRVKQLEGSGNTALVSFDDQDRATLELSSNLTHNHIALAAPVVV